MPDKRKNRPLILDKDFRLRKRVIFTMLLIFALVLTIILFYYDNHKTHLKTEAKNNLLSISELKASEIYFRIQDLKNDAKILQNNTILSDKLYSYQDLPGMSDSKQEIKHWFEALTSSNRYESIRFLDTNANFILGDTLDYKKPGKFLKEAIKNAVKTKETYLSDFHFYSDSTTIHLDLLVPIYKRGSGNVERLLALEINPYKYIYPIIKYWPFPNRSAEIILTEDTGDEVLILSDLRFRNNSALKYRIRKDNTEMLLAKPPTGDNILDEGIDYRGNKVLGVIRPVDGTKWKLVTKIDRDEVYSEINNVTNWVILIIVILVITSSLILYYYISSISIYHRIREKNLEEEKQVLEEHYSKFIGWTNDVLILADIDGKIVRVNRKAEEIYGYTKEEFTGLTIRDIRGEISKEDTKNFLDEIRKVKRLKFETFHRKKDGTDFLVDVSSSIIDLDGKSYIQGIIRDISERDRMMNEIKKSEEQYRELVNNIPGTVYHCEVHFPWRMYYMTPEIENMSGYKVSDFIDGRITYGDIVHKDDIRMVDDAVEEGVKEKRAYFMEYRIIHKDGTVKWVQEKGHAFYNSKGEPDRLEGVILDITMKKTAEEREKKRTRELTELLDSLPGYAFFKDRESRYITANKSFCDMMGIGINDLTGKSEYDIYPKELADKYLREDIEVMSGSGKLLIRELEIEQDGKKINILIRKVPYKDDDGKIIGLIGLGFDITENKKLYEEKIRSDEQIRKLIEASPDGISISDNSGTVTYVSPKILELFNLISENDIIGTHVTDWIAGTDKERAILNIANVTNGIYSSNNQYQTIRKDGSVFYSEINSSTLKDEKGNVTGMISIIRDVTDKKLRENELKEAKENAEQANKLKTSFLANMSHEIRTPLIGILGFSEILKDEFDDALVKKYADTIHKGGIRLLETMNLVLDLSKIESGIESAELKIINLNRVLADTIKLFEVQAAKKNLEVIGDFIKSDIYVEADEKYIRSSLSNIINNAIKYTDKGSITITTESVFADGIEWGVVRIKDTGIGISPENMELIFEEFRQVSEGYSRRFEGTGLGLSITRKFIEKMGGKISVLSKKGIGSEFIIMLRKSDGQIRNYHTGGIYEKSITTLSKKHHILLVEDEEDNAAVIRGFLRNNFSVTCALNGEESIRIASETKFDAVLMDINLGEGITGLEAMKEIRKISGYENIPIIAVTAYAMKGDREIFIKSGFTHYISKPFEKKKLITILGKIIKE